MDVAWLLDFIALARTLNFTRAAEERHVTQSAFSRRIKALERWVGAPLVDRSAFPVRLLPSGDEFLPVAKAVVRDLLETRDAVRSRNLVGPKFQTFAAPHSISSHRLAPLLRDFHAGHPKIRTRVMSDDLHACCRLLAEGASEFLVCYRHPGVTLTLDEARFARLDLGSERLSPVCVPNAAGAPKWLLPGKARAPVPVLAYAPGSYFGAVVEQTLRAQRAHVSVRHLDAFAEALKALALLGHGVAWLPEASVAEAVHARRLVSAGEEKWHAALTLSVFAAPGRLDREGLALWEFLREVARRSG